MKRFDVMANIDDLKAAGIDWRGTDDTVFGTTLVYCSQHLTVHNPGWCTVGVMDKIALQATTFEDAANEVRALDLYIYGDDMPCRHCGVMLRDPHSSSGTWTDADGGLYCAPEPGKKKRRLHERQSLRVG